MEISRQPPWRTPARSGWIWSPNHPCSKTWSTTIKFSKCSNLQCSLKSRRGQSVHSSQSSTLPFQIKTTALKKCWQSWISKKPTKRHKSCPATISTGSILKFFTITTFGSKYSITWLGQISSSLLNHLSSIFLFLTLSLRHYWAEIVSSGNFFDGSCSAFSYWRILQYSVAL